MYKRVEATIGGRQYVVETGKLARQANGAVVVTYGETVVLVSAVAATEPRESVDFLPLTVEYQERLYAVGRIPGSFFRREIGRPSEKETLSARQIDRPLRPLFPAGWTTETQVIATVLSADQQNDPDTLAVTGASAALTVSDIHFAGPVAAVRVGYIAGEYVVNPTQSELQASSLNLVVAGSREAVVMVEGGAGSVPEEVVQEAIFFAHREMQPLIAIQEELRAAVGRPKRPFSPPAVDAALVERVQAMAREELAQALTTPEKMQRYARIHELKARIIRELGEEAAGREGQVKAAVQDLQKRLMRERIFGQRTRIDGRRFDEVRPISCEVGVLPRTHGSALFTRGETQTIVTTTLGSSEDEQKIESLYGESAKPFMLHYNFPPYCVGEVRPLRGPSRRDIGHGALAERSLRAVLPKADSFPYTIRVVSEVLESNGSSSMATACGGSLALMDAGVPVKGAVAGIAMGLIKGDDEIVILSDIIGDEDHLGDMDFKVVGTETGITALQMDIKITGVTEAIMTAAFAQARAGRLHILGKMGTAIASPRQELSIYAPKITTMEINPDKIRDLIGPGGKMIRGLTAEFGVKIEVEDSGQVRIFAPNGDLAAKVVARVREITQEVEVGRIYRGIVKKVVEFGAFVEVLPGTDGLVHISQLEDRRVQTVSEVLKEGDEVMVKVLEVDRQGKIRLSRKAAMAELKAGQAG
ncbi:MAG: polyribonucleotide nucleotidyltransferase [Thermodesulfobacteriota bacterium]